MQNVLCKVGDDIFCTGHPTARICHCAIIASPCGSINVLNMVQNRDSDWYYVYMCCLSLGCHSVMDYLSHFLPLDGHGETYSEFYFFHSSNAMLSWHCCTSTPKWHITSSTPLISTPGITSSVNLLTPCQL